MLVSPLLSNMNLCMLYIVFAMQGVKMLDVVSAKLFLNAVNIGSIDF